MSASFTLTDQRFPNGTTVKAYPASNWPTPGQPSGAPIGPASAEGTVSGSSVTLSGLEQGTRYWAVAEVGGAYVYVKIIAGEDVAKVGTPADASVTPAKLQGAPPLAANELLGYDGSDFTRVPNKSAFWLPSGVIDETVPPFLNGASNLALISGKLYLIGNLLLPDGVTSLGCELVAGSTSAATSTHLWTCLVGRDDLKIKAVSADNTAASPWTKETAKEFTWAESFTAVGDTPVYLGVVSVATTPPSLASGQGGAGGEALRLKNPLLGGNSTTGLTTPKVVGTTVAEPSGLFAMPIAYLK